MHVCAFVQITTASGEAIVIGWIFPQILLLSSRWCAVWKSTEDRPGVQAWAKRNILFGSLVCVPARKWCSFWLMLLSRPVESTKTPTRRVKTETTATRRISSITSKREILLVDLTSLLSGRTADKYVDVYTTPSADVKLSGQTILVKTDMFDSLWHQIMQTGPCCDWLWNGLCPFKGKQSP